MGKGRTLSHAMHSKITPMGRWCPKPNARARCMRTQMLGKKGGNREEQLKIFFSASDACKVKGR